MHIKATTSRKLKRVMMGIVTLSLSACSNIAGSEDELATQSNLAGPTLPSLDVLSVDALRARSYGQSGLEFLERLEGPCTSGEVSGETPSRATRHLASYVSEGQSIYARVDVPIAEQPVDGYPVLVFAHGWVGAENAPNWHFGCTTDSPYGDIYGNIINAWVNAGYVALVPGYRGHGTVNGVPADGHEDMLSWDNSAYLMPSFYAVDVMNLIAASQIDGGMDVPIEEGTSNRIKIDRSRIYINGHSQGGDVALTVLAAVGEGAPSGLQLAGGSIWAGNIADRFEQVATFEAISTSPESFLSGDGTWTGTAIGANGIENPNFVFGFPPDWIGSPHPSDWGWQKETFTRASVADALQAKAAQMYDILHAQVLDLSDLTWRLETDAFGRAHIEHDPRLISLMSRIGGTHLPQYISEPLNLHYSDRDFYSLPKWNEELCADISDSDGTCRTFEYFGNTHSLGVSEHEWFSPPGTVAGHATFIERDLCIFSRDDSDLSDGDYCQSDEKR